MDDPLNDPLLLAARALGDWGVVLVIWGVVGEVFAALVDFISEKNWGNWHSRWKGKIRLFEFISGGVLIFGLAMEYRGHKQETGILDADNAALHARASTNELRAALVESNNLVLSVNVENLRSNNLVLAGRLADSLKSLAQIEMVMRSRPELISFKSSERLKKYAGMGFIISVDPNPQNDDGVMLAATITGMLQGAGWILTNGSDASKEYLSSDNFPSHRDGVIIMGDFGERDKETQAASSLAAELESVNVVAVKWPHKNRPANLIAIQVRKRPALTATEQHEALKEWQEHFRRPPSGQREWEEWDKKNEELWRKATPPLGRLRMPK